jgi:small-conductance mechanosensitive channel
LIQEIDGVTRTWSWAQWTASAWHYFRSIWNTELVDIEDQPLTIGKVISMVLLIVGGFVLSRLFSRWFGARLQGGRMHLNASDAAPLQSLCFYVLLLCFSLSALRLANVPLTAFTFLGGAVAIGVGFGSQNLVNNFISGLVILTERPIKVGDLVHVENLYGNVEHIGARSTRVRTGENLEIVVPNSKFLENNVVNLTRSDDKLRAYIKIGTAYGSPVREVMKLLRRAAEEHGRVLENPTPFVWFADFGDNALCFELHFWIRARTVSERRRIESDLRCQVDQLFREAGITVAFPQRDIHLATATPIVVRLDSQDGPTSDP